MKHLASQSRVSKARAGKCLVELGLCIEELENAAKNGDWEMVDRWHMLCAANIGHTDRFINDIYTIDDIADVVHQNAIDHGWYEKRRSFGDVVALMHSELSEALEEYRDKKPLFYKDNGKPEGIATELIDCIIRILDTLRRKGVPIEKILWAKHRYNESRPYRHGGKRC